jgi:hypothetical protein
VIAYELGASRGAPLSDEKLPLPHSGVHLHDADFGVISAPSRASRASAACSALRLVAPHELLAGTLFALITIMGPSDGDIAAKLAWMAEASSLQART